MHPSSKVTFCRGLCTRWDDSQRQEEEEFSRCRPAAGWMDSAFSTALCVQLNERGDPTGPLDQPDPPCGALGAAAAAATSS